MNRGKHYQAVLGIVVFLFLVGLGYCGMLFVKDSNGYQNGMESKATTSPNFNRSYKGVVKAIDEENQTISIVGIDNAVQMNIKYNGGTDVKDQYGKIISVKGIIIGEIVAFSYDSRTNKMVSMSIDKDAWTYENVKKMKLDSEKGVIQLGSSRYAFHNGLLYVSNNEIISLSDLSGKDQLTLKGIGETVYSIIVTKGHGIIHFTNINDFVGGTVYIGASTYKTVKKEPFNIIVREGSYKITMQNGELIGTKQITIERNQELTVDMSEFKISKSKIGYVTFNINPYGADLYINGNATDYSKPIKLNYGNHTIIVKLAGYKGFSGILTVGQSEQDIDVTLVPDSSDEDSSSDNDVKPEKDKTDSDDIVLDWDSDKTDSDNNATQGSQSPIDSSVPSFSTDKSGSETSKVDTLHKITVSSPEGVEVYLDDAYKGIAPVSFSKTLGTHIITLKKDRYTSKTYTIHVEDNNEDIFYTFEALVKK